MTGSGTLIKHGAGNLVLTGANNYGSGTAVNAGTLTGNSTSLHGYFYNDATIVFNQSTDGVFAGEIYGTGNVRKTGSGSLTFSNTSVYSSGQTIIEAGRLAVDAELASDVEVDPGATLGGNGLVTGNVHNNGTLAAGNSIGTLHINGNYTDSPGSTTHVEINDGGTTPGVNNDLVVVDGFPPISGVATLNGATVTYSAAPGRYVTGSKYTFLQAQSIVGSYSGVTNLGPSNVRAMLGYGTINISGVDWMTVYLMLLNSQSNFAANAQTFNQYGVANYIDLNSTDPTPEMQALIDTLDGLSVPQQQAAFESMTAQVNGTMAQLQVQDTTFLYMMLRRRVGSAYAASGMSGGGGFANSGSSGYASAPSTANFAARGSGGGATVIPASYQSSIATKTWLTPTSTRRRFQPSWGGWVAGYGFGGNAQTDGNAAGGTYGSGGTIVALERPLDNEHLIGLFGAYSNLGLRLSGLPQSANANQGLFGGYFLRDIGSMYLLAAASAGFTGYRETRQMTFGNINSTARGDYSGWSPSAYLEYGHRYQLGRTIVQPYGALQYIYVRQNAFTETGAGTLNQAVGGIDTNALRGLLGSRFAQVGTTRGGSPILPELRAAWMHEFLEPNSTLNATFAPVGGSSFAARGLNFGRDWAVLGTGMQYVMNRNVSLFANYDLLFNANQAWNAGSGGVQFVW
jgi:outer membrane autotransporter protein